MKEVNTLALDGRLLKIFMAVYEFQSVSEAARHLGTSQSAVSHSLNRLRDCIGDPLFVKDGRNIISSPAATALAPKIAGILAELEGLALAGQYDPRRDTGQFTIATNVTELLLSLTALKQRISEEAPNVRLRFIELGGASNALDYLASGKADLAITAGVGRYPLELGVMRLYEDVLCCFFDRDQTPAPMTATAYSALGHATLDFGKNQMSIVDRALESLGLSRTIRLSAANSYALAKLMQGTAYVATLPSRLKDTAFEGFAHSVPPLSLPKVSYDMVWHRREAQSPRHVWLRDRLRASMTD
ncbi:LysR family transcriptional regulator [uncultured Roseobacter sp.]|nr:LysR family transcriptional regulator [uncultured Roseobacter sp.]